MNNISAITPPLVIATATAALALYAVFKFKNPIEKTAQKSLPNDSDETPDSLSERKTYQIISAKAATLQIENENLNSQLKKEREERQIAEAKYNELSNAFESAELSNLKLTEHIKNLIQDYDSLYKRYDNLLQTLEEEKVEEKKIENKKIEDE